MKCYFMAALPLLALTPVVEGCIGLSCTEEARASVLVTVVDEMDAIQRDAKVTFSVEGRAEQAAECVDPTGAGTSCDSWIGGYEQTGSFTVKAASADGTKHAETTFMVDADECHVETQTIKLTLM